MEFVREDSNAECYKAKEFNYLKRLKQGVKWQSNCVQVIIVTLYEVLSLVLYHITNIPYCLIFRIQTQDK